MLASVVCEKTAKNCQKWSASYASTQELWGPISPEITNISENRKNKKVSTFGLQSKNEVVPTLLRLRFLTAHSMLHPYRHALITHREKICTGSQVLARLGLYGIAFLQTIKACQSDVSKYLYKLTLQVPSSLLNHRVRVDSTIIKVACIQGSIEFSMH